MKVALITTWQERCGIALYAENIVNSVKGVDFTIVSRSHFNDQSVMEMSKDCQIVHVNYEPGLYYWMDDTLIRRLMASGKATVMTLHTSTEGNNNNSSLTAAFSKVVVHESTKDNCTVIAHGIPETPEPAADVNNRLLGTAGFPFPWKGFPEVAGAAELLGMTALVIAPESDHANTHVVEELVKQRNPSAQYIKDWYSEKEVIKKLQTCQALVFAYWGGNSGISGAVRMGLAAKRPIVLSRSRQFRDLFPYEDEIEFVEDCTTASLVTAINKVLESGKCPDRLLKDMSWSRVGISYKNLYDSLVTCSV